MRQELYYAIINIVDFLALAEVDKLDQSELYRILDKLLAIDSGYNGMPIDEEFNTIADANDAGGVKTWQEMVEVFKELHEKGERI
jgi:hypothetical protein